MYRYVLLLLLILSLSACTTIENQYSIHLSSDDFVLEVVGVNAEIREEDQLKAVLTYNGVEDILISHGEDLIIMYLENDENIIGKNGTDLSYNESFIHQGDVIEYDLLLQEYQSWKAGHYTLQVITFFDKVGLDSNGENSIEFLIEIPITVK